jgi:hypothetical protein
MPGAARRPAVRYLQSLLGVFFEPMQGPSLRRVLTLITSARRPVSRRRLTFAALILLACTGGLASAFAHKPRPTPQHHSQRCPLVDGHGGNFDSARTDALMKNSRCWLTI